MNKAYEEVKLAVINEKHYLSTETMEYCLEALRIVTEGKHNGYTNYPTWLVATWIDNHEDLYKKYTELGEELHEAKEDKFNALGIMAQSIELDFSTECMKYQLITNNTVWSAMLNHCEKDLINYREIAEQYI